MTIFKVSYMKWELAQLDRHRTVNTKVLVGKPFTEINLPFTMKQYKNDIAIFVYYGKTRLIVII